MLDLYSNLVHPSASDKAYLDIHLKCYYLCKQNVYNFAFTTETVAYPGGGGGQGGHAPPLACKK